MQTEKESDSVVMETESEGSATPLGNVCCSAKCKRTHPTHAREGTPWLHEKTERLKTREILCVTACRLQTEQLCKRFNSEHGIACVADVQR